mgnify:CR=1 FL=1
MLDTRVSPPRIVGEARLRTAPLQATPDEVQRGALPIPGVEAQPSLPSPDSLKTSNAAVGRDVEAADGAIVALE